MTKLALVQLPAISQHEYHSSVQCIKEHLKNLMVVEIDKYLKFSEAVRVIYP